MDIKDKDVKPARTRSAARRRGNKAQQEVVPQKPLVEAIQDVFKEYGVSGVLVPSWKRVAVATVACGVLAYSAGYGIGVVAAYAIAGIMTLNGSVLLSFLIAILAVAIAIYAGAKIGQHVGNYILSGRIDQDIVVLKNKVTGFFKRSKEPISDAVFKAA